MFVLRPCALCGVLLLDSRVLCDLPLQSIRFAHHPLTRVMFLSNDSIVGAGYDFNPLLFSADASGFWCDWDARCVCLDALLTDAHCCSHGTRPGRSWSLWTRSRRRRLPRRRLEASTWVREARVVRQADLLCGCSHASLGSWCALARSMWQSKVTRGQSSDATQSDKGALWTCVWRCLVSRVCSVSLLIPHDALALFLSCYPTASTKARSRTSRRTSTLRTAA